MKRRGVVMYEVREYGGVMWGDDVRQSWLFNTAPAEQPWRPRRRASWRYWESAEWQGMLRRWQMAILAATGIPQAATWSDHSEPVRFSTHAAGRAMEVRAEARMLAQLYAQARVEDARAKRAPLIRPGDGA